MKIKNFTILLILLSFAMLLVSGCDDRDLPTSTDAEYKIVRLESTVDLIYADNNVTFAYISAYVKDNNNFGAAEIPVRFQTDRGSIVTAENTNQSGIAKVPFYDAGEVGEATITAIVFTYSQYDATEITGEDAKSIKVTIAEKPPVGDLTIEISSNEFIVNQSVLVRARVFDALTNPVADSTMIRFETDRGFFVAADGETNMGSIAIIPTQNGMAPLNLNVGQQAGMGSVSVRIDTLSASRNFNVKPGNPFNLNLLTYLGDEDLNIIEETSETTLDNEYNIVIQANLKDAYNNASPNKVIRFETDLGSFYNTSESYTQNTDADGIAKVVFTPGLSAGPATIKAFANNDTLSTEALFTIKSDELYSIRFNNTDQITLNVANTGGVDSKILYVNLFDINGNLIDNATDIYFKIINSNIPGSNNGQPAYLSNQDEDGVVYTTSSGGQAAVSVVAGTGSGVIQLRVANQREALANTQIEGAITATKTNILIQAGPPANISWGDVAFDQGTNVGGGMWELLLAVSVKDIYNNPVSYGTSVFYELTNQANLPATIQANGYTGNGPEVSANDAGASQIDSTSSIGISYTLLTYSGSLTYSDLELNARCVGGYGEDINESYILEVPWNAPDTDMQVTPGNIDFWDGDPGASGSDFLWAIVTVRARDGQGFPTPGVFWTFTADRGYFYDYQVTFTQTNEATTAADGYARIRLKIFRDYGLPSPDGITPGQQQIQIEGRVLGTGITQRGNTLILRYPGPNPAN
jgi:hypothetical protein